MCARFMKTCKQVSSTGDRSGVSKSINQAMQQSVRSH